MSGTIFSRSILAFTSIVLVGATACTADQAIGPTAPLANESEGRGVFQRYFAIGTSVSAGVQSDGLIAATQMTSWPAQLAAGCRTLPEPAAHRRHRLQVASRPRRWDWARASAEKGPEKTRRS